VGDPSVTLISQHSAHQEAKSHVSEWSAARVRSLVWPREHGAWGILLVPLVTGAAVGLAAGRGLLPLLLFTLAALALFCLRVPVEVLLETTPLRVQNPGERRAVVFFLSLYALIAAASLAILFWSGRANGLLLLGGAAAAALGLQAVLRKLGRDMRMSSQLVGAIGLTSTAAGACYVATGHFDTRALVLWAANWLFAANQIHYVQLRIHAARAASRAQKLSRGWGFLVNETSTALLLGLAWRLALLPGWATLAFAPILLRGLAWFLRPHTPLHVHSLGKLELAHAILFCLLFVLALLLS
jgi:YwiC-like protein